MLNESELVEMVFDHVCEHHAEAVAELRDEEIQRRARVAVQRALQHGFRQETSVAAFAALMFLVAPNFDEQPAIRAALSMPGLTPDDCMEMLLSKTAEQDWEAAGAMADESAWCTVVASDSARP